MKENFKKWLDINENVFFYLPINYDIFDKRYVVNCGVSK